MTTLTTIETPERVALTYDVAGLGTRALAYLIDLGVRAAAILLGLVAVFVIHEDQQLAALSSGVRAAGVIGFFLLHWGYATLFEAFWNGQTPGKRLMGIRVIKEGGFPATLFDAALRNLIRVVDFLPVFYGLGVVCLFLTKRHQRVGDLAAGTLVVRQSTARPPSLDDILAAHSHADADAGPRYAQAPVSVQQFEAIVEFLQRAERLDPQARGRIAEKFAEPIRRSIAESKTLREAIDAGGLDDETLLALVVHDRRSEQAADGPAAEGGGNDA
ncbi:MAG: RDD family protein [Planctomycetes bacterium]|nr:RDD family protein [Planctomycetota bacterium]